MSEQVGPGTNILGLLGAGARIEFSSGYWLQGSKVWDDTRMGYGTGDMPSQSFLGYGEATIDMAVQDLGELAASMGHPLPALTRNTTLHDLMRLGLRVCFDDRWLLGMPEEKQVHFGTRHVGILGRRDLSSEFGLRSALSELERIDHAKVVAFPRSKAPPRP